MNGLLEVIALHANDAKSAEAGGADRIELRGLLPDSTGMSPEPRILAEVRAATSVPIRVMVRLREGYGTDGGEATRLRGLIASYLDAGADGLVIGFLNGHGDVDLEVIHALIDGGDWPWTFHRALDACLNQEQAWVTLRTLPRLDCVLTAGSARDVEHGLDELIRRAQTDDWAADHIMAGGSLQPEHVPWLTRAGIRSFHIGAPARPGGSYQAFVDEKLVRSWRMLIDDECEAS